MAGKVSCRPMFTRGLKLIIMGSEVLATESVQAVKVKTPTRKGENNKSEPEKTTSNVFIYK